MQVTPQRFFMKQQLCYQNHQNHGKLNKLQQTNIIRKTFHIESRNTACRNNIITNKTKHIEVF